MSDSTNLCVVEPPQIDKDLLRFSASCVELSSVICLPACAITAYTTKAILINKFRAGGKAMAYNQQCVPLGKSPGLSGPWLMSVTVNLSGKDSLSPIEMQDG